MDRMRETGTDGDGGVWDAPFEDRATDLLERGLGMSA